MLLAVLLADELVGEAELLRELVHDHVVGARLEQRLDHLLAPLQRAVGRRHRALGLELRRDRQQVGAVLAHLGEHRRARRRIRVEHHHQVELLHRLHHLEAARLRVRRVAPEEDRAQVRSPGRWPRSSRSRRRSSATPSCRAWPSSPRRRTASSATRGRRSRPWPSAPTSPARDRVVARQRVGVRADVGRALHVVVAAVDVAAAARARRCCRARASGCWRRARWRWRWCAASGPSPR